MKVLREKLTRKAIADGRVTVGLNTLPTENA
jgi:hypothetical protein